MAVDFQYDISVEKTKQSRIDELDFDNIPFGKKFADHMFIADYKDGEWQSLRIVPFQRLSINPAMSALHYGQSIFEGMKAFKDPQGNPQLFRPERNAKRFNRSAHRMAMPEIPESLFLEALKKLVKLDQDWIPPQVGSALYLRPFMFATDEYIGIKPADTFKFMIFTCPVGPYYPKPVKLKVAEKYVRAFPGGTGYAKAAGNYGGALHPLRKAQEEGYDQILWMDGFEFKYVQECGTMNIFFMIDDTIITPALSETILDGVTRDSIIQLCKDRGLTVEERDLSIEEIAEAEEKGVLQDAFGTGTAATLAQIDAIGYQGKEIQLPDVDNRPVSGELKEELELIRNSEQEDKHNWVVKI